MSLERFDIFFSGQLLPEHAPDQVRDAVGRLFRANHEQLDRLFNGTPVRIKRGVDAETACRYQAKLRAAGALVDIRPSTTTAEASLQRLRRIFDGSNDAIFVVDPTDGHIMDCNRRAEETLGFGRQALLAMRIPDLQAEDGKSFRVFANEVLAKGASFSEEFQYAASHGGRVPVEISASVLDLDEGQALLFMARDISERKLADSRIQHLAYHDTLTDLPNRTLLKDRVQSALARARRSGDLGALLFLDLDNFKRINDTLGHAVGDRLLQDLSRRLIGALRAEDTVARLGGDEFVVLVERLGPAQTEAQQRIEEIAAKIRASMARPYRLDGHELYVTASIGIVTFPENGADVDELLRCADVAMYQAKESGRNAARVFSEDMNKGAMERLELESELRRALQHGDLMLYYQPVMTLREGQMVGAEALMRWRHNGNSLITPTEFLPQIEDSSLMVQLADWVLEEACRTLAKMQQTESFKRPSYIAVNLSHLQFRQSGFVDQVRDVLERTGADPNLLQFEITESSLDHDPESATERLQTLRQVGIRFAIDDFGTGYSSLAALKELPVDTLKIDRTFIHNLTDDPGDAAIVEAILSLARHFNLTAIAEGVENRQQLLFLRDRGCRYYQGMLGRPPLDEGEFREEVLHRAALRAMA